MVDNSGSGGVGSGASGEDTLASHLDAEFILFIQDKTMLQHIQTIMQERLKFTNISLAQVGNTRKEAIEKLAKILLTNRDAVVIVYPALSFKKGEQETKIDVWNNFLINLMTRIDQTKNDKEKTLNCLSKVITVLEEAENYIIRENFIRLFASFRIPSVFIFPITQSAKMKEQIEERLPILRDYLEEHLTNKGSAIEKIKDKEKELELSKRKAEADKLIQEGKQHKENRNFQEAVNCFEKAIKIFPDDPDAYIESGRGFTKLKKYGRAVRRFSEAEEIAKDTPTPNTEIGNVKILQAKEMIEKGADPDSLEVAQLLEDASASFQTALDKAEELKPLHQDDTADRSGEAISEIVRNISEHQLSEHIGMGNKAVKNLHSLVGKSLEKKGISESEDMSTPDRITLGLVAADDGRFDDAERMLFQAVLEDKKYFHDACWGINYLGAQIRQSGKVDEAFKVYYRLLQLDPPNKAAVHFNLAVAWAKKDNEIEAAGEIVQAVYTDPGMPHDEMFHKNVKIKELFERLLAKFEKVTVNMKTMKPKLAPEPQEPGEPEAESTEMFSPEPNPLYAEYKKKFEQVIKADRQQAMRALYDFTVKKGDFFYSAEAYGSMFIMDIIRETHGKMKDIENPTIKKFVYFLENVVEKEKLLALPSNPSFVELRHKFEEVIRTNRKTADRALYDFMMARPGFFASVEVYNSEPIMALVAEAHAKYGSQSNLKIKKFVGMLGGVLDRKNLFSPKANGERETWQQKLMRLAGERKVDEPMEVMKGEKGHLDALDDDDFYESVALVDFAENALEKYGASEEPAAMAVVRYLRGFLNRQEKYVAFKNFKEEASNVYMETMDQRKMVNFITKAIVSYPESVDMPFFYKDSEIVNASFEIHKKLAGKGVGKEYEA